MSVDVQIIEPLTFFKDLTYDEQEEFAASLNMMTVKKGDVIIRKGTPALTFFIIVSGAYRVSSDLSDAPPSDSAGQGPSITLDAQGDIMGWSTVVAPFHYQGTVEVLKDGELLYLSSRDFFQLIQNNNQLGEKIMKKINKVATQRRAILSGSK